MRWIALALCIALPQAAAAQNIGETMKGVIKGLPPSAFVAPDMATTFLIATLDPGFRDDPALASAVVSNASRLILPQGQIRRKFAQTVGARFLLRSRTPAEIAALMLTQAHYGRGCQSLESASLSLFDQAADDADARVLLTLVTLTQAPTFYANTPDRLAIAFELNVMKLAESDAITPEMAARLLQLGPAPLAMDARCAE